MRRAKSAADMKFNQAKAHINAAREQPHDRVRKLLIAPSIYAVKFKAKLVQF